MAFINGTLEVETIQGELEGSKPESQRGLKRKHRELAQDTDVKSAKPKTEGSSRQEQHLLLPNSLMASKSHGAIPSSVKLLDSTKGTSHDLGPWRPAKVTKPSGSVTDDSHKAPNAKKRKQAKLEAELLRHTISRPPAPEPPMPRPPVPKPIPIVDSSGDVQAFLAVQDHLSTTSSISALLNPADDPDHTIPRQAPRVHLLPPTVPSIDGSESPGSPLDLSSAPFPPPTNLDFINYGLDETYNHPGGPSLFDFDDMNFSMADHPDMVDPSLLTPPVMTPSLSLDSSSNSQDSWGTADLSSHDQPEETERGFGDYSY